MVQITIEEALKQAETAGEVAHNLFGEYQRAVGRADQAWNVYYALRGEKQVPTDENVGLGRVLTDEDYPLGERVGG
jgi:hypothetical protein